VALPRHPPSHGESSDRDEDQQGPDPESPANGLSASPFESDRNGPG
jgi:hypothetical protein